MTRQALFPFFRKARHIAVLILLSSLAAVSQVRFLESGKPQTGDPDMGLPAPSRYRTIIDLNGGWQYKTDRSPDWKSVIVPSSYFGEENVTFKRSFHVDAPLVREAVFQLSAVSISYYCEIHINDRFIGKHAGATSFSFKLSPGILRGGRNTITIAVRNRLNAQETLPLAEQLWDRKQYGGILHDIAIIAHRSVWVQESNVVLRAAGEGKSGTIEYRALLNSGPISKRSGDSLSPAPLARTVVEHMVEVFDAQSGELVLRSETRRVEIESDRLVSVQMSLALPSVKLWSPETPNLYTLVQKTFMGGTQLDESSLQVGFKDFRVVDGRFVLNGAPIFLKGTTYIESSPLRGRSMSADELERDILIMKNLGANSVRLLHGAVHPAFLALCDRYGLLVFQDLPAVGVPSRILGSRAFQASARNMLREMLVRDSHHPSIAAVGLGSAIDASAAGFESYVAALSASVHDNHDLPVYASFIVPPQDSKPDGIDFAGVDLPPSSSARVKSVMDLMSQSQQSGPLLLSSVTYPVEVGNYNGYSDPRSIDAQAQFFLEVYNEAVSGKAAGMFVHSFSDWEVSFPIMSADRVQQFMATAGILDAHRQKRIAYEVLKARFNNEKPPVLAIGNNSPEHPASFVVVGLLLILVFALMYNLFRRFRENVVRSFLRPFNFFSDVRDQRMLSIFQTTIIGLLGSASAALLAANLLYFWRTNYTVDTVLHQFLRSVWLKQWFNFAAWEPLADIAAGTAVFFAVLLICALLLRAAAFLLRRNLLMFDAYSVAMWCMLPMVFLSPFGLVLYRIMEAPLLEAAAALTLAAFLVWVYSRLLKGAAIVLDSRPVFFYIAGYAMVAAGITVWLLLLDSSYETVAYLRYILDVWLYMYGLPA